jgi:6-pyruvoyltetrahydropterin/6-carboxytetrahydropterin synthase
MASFKLHFIERQTMCEPQYTVELAKDVHTFSAAHFITFNGNICESLHGHNYRVRCEVTGNLDENAYVIDFIALRDRLTAITRSLDHRVLLPTQHTSIKVASNSREITATFEDKRWVFPKEDCVLLPISNTTAELLARYIGQQLLQDRANLFHSGIRSIKVMVDENQGQWGAVALSIDP